MLISTNDANLVFVTLFGEKRGNKGRKDNIIIVDRYLIKDSRKQIRN